MKVVAIFNPFSKWSSEIFDEILHFLYFIPENICSQMYILPTSDDMNNKWLLSL